MIDIRTKSYFTLLCAVKSRICQCGIKRNITSLEQTQGRAMSFILGKEYSEARAPE